MRTRLTKSVVAAGYAPLDVVIHRDQVSHSAGGTAGNVAAILSFLGWQSTLVGEVGDDVAGVAFLEDLRRAGVRTTDVVVAPGSTARIVHKTGASGHSFEYSCPSCGFHFPKNRRLGVARAESLGKTLDPPDVLFLDRANPGTVRLAQLLSERGSKIVFEPAFSLDATHADRLFRLADIVKFAADSGVASMDDLRAGKEKQIQVITAGGIGAHCRIGDASWDFSPAFDYPTVDAAGAGDWTTACLLHALSSGDATNNCLRDALSGAQAVAAVSCGTVGARGLAHVRSRESIMRSAKRLAQAQSDRRSSPRRMRGQLGLMCATAEDVCRTCLEATDPESGLAIEVGWKLQDDVAAPTNRGRTQRSTGATRGSR